MSRGWLLLALAVVVAGVLLLTNLSGLLQPGDRWRVVAERPLGTGWAGCGERAGVTSVLFAASDPPRWASLTLHPDASWFQAESVRWCVVSSARWGSGPVRVERTSLG